MATRTLRVAAVREPPLRVEAAFVDASPNMLRQTRIGIHHEENTHRVRAPRSTSTVGLLHVIGGCERAIGALCARWPEVLLQRVVVLAALAFLAVH